ncbi:cell wall-binding repeat-containing protein [Mobiluncus mulieris]|nr:cell wall-binding repeat-containing protein [Mobiluncus mulieris]
MIHAIFKPRMKWATSITTIATSLALTLTPSIANAVHNPDSGNSDGKYQITRIFGSDRYHTAWKIARYVFKNDFNPQGRVMKKIYVASGDNPADTLAASNLKDGALLLAPPRLSPEHGVTWEQSTYIGFAVEPSVTSITVLGGQGAVEDRVISRSLRNSSVSLPVNRIYGANRYETAAQIAKQAYPSGVKKVYLACGNQPADALAASNLKDGALLLAPPTLDNPSVTTTVSNAIKELGADSVTVLGGQGALPDQVVSAITGLPTNRVAGSDRYETAALIAKQAWPGGVKKVYLARGDQPADALAASNLKDGPLLLAYPDKQAPVTVLNLLKEWKTSTLVLLGGEKALPNNPTEPEEANKIEQQKEGEAEYALKEKDVTEQDKEEIARYFIEYLNQYRAESGLAPVVYSSEISRFTLDVHQSIMRSNNGIDEHIHDIDTGRMPDGKFNGENLTSCNLYKHPLGWKRYAAIQLLESWKNSPGHNEIMLQPSNHRAGLALYREVVHGYEWLEGYALSAALIVAR